MDEKLNVTRAFLPSKNEYFSLIDQLWESRHLTNSGVLHQELEVKLTDFLMQKLVLVSNGTIALQIALKALNVKGDIITTPYSYVATLNSILWEGCSPIFVDINKNDFSLDANFIKNKITKNTKAILITHVYGIPGDLNLYQEIADEFEIPIIYDAAHAFGVKYKGKSVLSYGQLSTLSFHATKLFHTIEGGAIAFNSNELEDKLKLLRSFGHRGENYFGEGINGKMSEVHAAMGLINLNYVEQLIIERKKLSEYYNSNLKNCSLEFLEVPKDVIYNYSYYPVFFQNEAIREKAISELESNLIFPRRYFYPSLNNLPQVNYQECPVSEDISSRVLCLPLFNGLDTKNQDRVIEVLKKTVK